MRNKRRVFQPGADKEQAEQNQPVHKKAKHQNNLHVYTAVLEWYSSAVIAYGAYMIATFTVYIRMILNCSSLHVVFVLSLSPSLSWS